MDMANVSVLFQIFVDDVFISMFCYEIYLEYFDSNLHHNS